jgi:mono/diheme cytochrome c family protein
VGLTRLMRAPLGIAVAGLLAASAMTGAQTARAFPPDQIARGEAVWNRICVECHGPDSTNLDAPLLLRQDSLRRFPTAAAAHKFVSESMPSENPGTLTPEEYWDVLAFLLAQSNIGAGDAPLGPDTAGTIPTRAQGGAPKPAAPAGAPASPEKPDGESAPAEGEEAAPTGG